MHEVSNSRTERNERGGREREESSGSLVVIVWTEQFGVSSKVNSLLKTQAKEMVGL